MTKSSEIDLTKFAALISKKRARRPLRDIAEEIEGVSAPTLSRIEKGNVPDIDTFMRLCRWLEVSPNEFQSGEDVESRVTAFDTKDVVCAHLRADRLLPPETARALTTMIELAYRDVLSGKFDQQNDPDDND